MPVSAPDLGAFTIAEKRALLTAIKAEILLRVTPGSVRTASSAGQSFGVDKWSEPALTIWLNALTTDLGYQQPEIRVAPNFARSPWPAFTTMPVASSSSRLAPDVSTWADLAALSTTGMPNSTIIEWVEAATGLVHVSRLLPGTDATNTASGIQRPNDYANPGNARVWYDAA